MSKGKKIALWLVGILFLLVVVGGSIGFATFTRLLQHKNGEHTGGVNTSSIGQTWHDITEITGDPRAGFPGQDRVTILCMGIDDNWTNKDEVYTKDARTDTLFLLTLDLANRKATMLSIPRDTYAHIAGTHWNFKINAAYGQGGPPTVINTVDELLGVHADHYLVLNIDSTKKLVDALGGVDVDVEHEMHYHDKWGHLSIDLMPGQQHLTGDQAVGFARYRHGDAHAKGSPEDGDERRMYRQHVLLKGMVARAKTFSNVTQVNTLMDVAMSTINTDLTRTQLLDVASLYHGIQPDGILTASLPGDDFRGTDGAWLYKIYPDKAKAYVAWLVRGDESAARELTPIIVKNGTAVPGLAQRAVEQLKQNGYPDVQNGGNAAKPRVHLTRAETPAVPARTEIMDTGVPDLNSAQDAAATLRLPAPLIARYPLKPNKLGWTPPTDVTITLGQDYASEVSSAGDTVQRPDTAPAGQF